MTRIHIPRASKAQARRTAEGLAQLIARLREMEDFPAQERTREASRLRREQAQADFGFFARTYLPELIQGDGCALHAALAATCQQLADGRTVVHVDPGPFGELVTPAEEEEEAAEINAAALAAPRGHAKSTWGTIAFPTWCVLSGRKGYGQLCSDTKEQANGFVEAIRMILQECPRIRTDFGEIDVDGPEGTLDIVVPALPDGSKPKYRLARLQGFGSGQKLRGRTHQGRRPDLVILDDVENDEAVENPARRKKLRGWLTKAVLPGMDPSSGAFLMLGTVLHEESLLKSVLAMFGGAIWRCWDEDENPMWAERFPRRHLRWLRSKMDAEDPGSFAQEMENRAQGDDEKPFKAFLEYEQLPDRLELKTHVDPALGKRKGDYTALVTVGYASGVIYILDAVIRKLGPKDTGKKILEVRTAYPGKLQAEAVAYQEALKDILDLLADLEDIVVPVLLVTPKGDKAARIESMAPAVETGKILFPRLSPPARGNGSLEPMLCGGASGIRKLQEQLLQFPKAAHDDGPDALQGATAGRFKRKTFGGFGMGMKPAVEQIEVRL